MIPLRTDNAIRRTPVANYALIGANVLCFVVFGALGHPDLVRFQNTVLALNAGDPQWWQFFTYQFVHAGVLHLAGNMLFLWVFGNSVNAKFGNLAYVMYYLSAGAFAGWGFTVGHDNLLVGASGSIAGMTMTYVVLFPRSRILFLFWAFIITTFELPCLWVVLFKIVLWDNVLAPQFTGGGTNVAHEAHLFGYLYGFIAPIAMLLFGALSRDQFDLLALIKRWNQRRSFAVLMSDPQARARAQYGTVARPITLDPRKKRETEARLDRIAELRGQLHDALADDNNQQPALDLYEQLMVIDPQQYLPRRQQLEVARLLYSRGKYPQAAAAFEKYLKYYPRGAEIDEIRLLVGIIYARDLSQYEAAEGHLKLALDSVTDPGRREQCRQWLDRVVAVLRPAPPDPG